MKDKVEAIRYSQEQMNIILDKLKKYKDVLEKLINEADMRIHSV